MRILYIVRRFFSWIRSARDLFRRRRPDINWRLLRAIAPRRVPTFRQFRMLGAVLSVRERRFFALLGIVALLAGGTLVARAFISRLAYAPASGGAYTEGIVGAPQLLNPLFSSANDVDADLVRLTYAGLLRTNPSGALEPDLAASWTVSPDGKKHTLELRDGLRWSDGEPLTIEDVVFTFDAIKNSEWKSPLAPAFRRVAVERAGDRGISFTLAEPFSAFAQALTVGLLPSTVWGDIPPSSASLAEFNIKPIGAGPFRFKSLTRERSGSIKIYTFERNPRYHGSPPYLDRVILKFFPDMESASSALAARQIDGIGFLPLDVRNRFAGRGDLTAYRLALPQLTALFFNLRSDGPFTDLKVRRALAAAVDREQVVSAALTGEGEGLGGPMPPGSFPGISGFEFPVRSDLTAAEKLLDDAGWRLPRGGSVREKVVRDRKGRVTASSTLSFILITADRSELVAAANTLAAEWKKIGIAVSVSAVPPEKIQKEVIRPRAFDALLYGEVLGADPDPYPFWHSSQAAEGGFNLSGYKNRDVDTLLEAARAAQKSEDRAKKYTEFQKLVVADVPAIFLYRPYYALLLDRGIRGVDVSHVAAPGDRWNGITGWYRKTRPKFEKPKSKN